MSSYVTVDGLTGWICHRIRGRGIYRVPVEISTSTFPTQNPILSSRLTKLLFGLFPNLIIRLYTSQFHRISLGTDILETGLLFHERRTTETKERE